jgi:peptidyl-prolyl cis-trans isomerase D
MLQGLHNKAAGFFVKLLLGLLVASFALWGIGDIFRNSPANAVVEVGDSTVSAQEFKVALDGEMANYRRMLGDAYSPDILKGLGVPSQVLDKLVQQHLVEEEVRTQGLATPESYLKGELRNNAAFYGDDGRFDVQRFKAILAANNMSEGMYIDLLSKEIGADMLLQSVFSGIQATETAASLAYLYENETRKADVLVFKPALMKNAPAPQDSDLENFYNDNKDKFKAAEMRTFSMLALNTQELQSAVSVADEEVLIEYQNRIEEFRQPEKREVSQLLYDDEETAQKAANALDEGKSLQIVAKDYAPNNANVLLGMVTASAMMPEAEKQVFELEVGEHTAPIQTSFGWHVFQVTNIEPEHTRPLAEVREQLVADMRAQRVGEEAYELSNTLQDDLAGGATLEEAAQSIDGAVQSFGPVNREANAPEGKSVVLPESYPNLLSVAFDLDEGEVSNLMETDSGSYYVVRVDSVQPERVRPLDEVRDMVIDEWQKQQRNKTLYQLASGVAGTLANENIAQVARTTEATLLRNQSFSRSSTQFADGQPLPAIMLTAIFSAQKGAATEAFALSDGSYVVAKLTDIEKADPASEAGRAALQRAKDNLRAVYADELYLQYMAYLRKKHPVSEPNLTIINSLVQ